MGRLKALPSRLARLPARIAFLPREEAEAERFRLRDAVHEWRRWYKTARWKRLRLEVLDRDLWTCQATGVALTGKYPAPNSPVVDHKKPHRGDPALFWDPKNLHAVAKAWHDSEKQRQERAK